MYLTEARALLRSQVNAIDASHTDVQVDNALRIALRHLIRKTMVNHRVLEVQATANRADLTIPTWGQSSSSSGLWTPDRPFLVDNVKRVELFYRDRGEWSPGVAYEAYDVVSYGGLYYRCTAAYTSPSSSSSGEAATTVPGTASGSSYWALTAWTGGEYLEVKTYATIADLLTKDAHTGKPTVIGARTNLLWFMYRVPDINYQIRFIHNEPLVYWVQGTALSDQVLLNVDDNYIEGAITWGAPIYLENTHPDRQLDFQRAQWEEYLRDIAGGTATDTGIMDKDLNQE